MECGRVDKHLVCGTTPTTPWCEVSRKTENGKLRPLEDISHSIVLVGLWDHKEERIVEIGSGFVADTKLGLIVTARHTFFDTIKEEGIDHRTHYKFGNKYKGRDANVLIGVIPKNGENGTDAVFRYFAEIVPDDDFDMNPCMDACILKITERFMKDLPSYSWADKKFARYLESMEKESLSQLELTEDYEKGHFGDHMRILGFNQGGEGRLEKGEVNTTLDHAIGYICRVFVHHAGRDDTERKEVVVNCFTIGGHSGGPCVDEDGKVVGILSRHDGTGQRCFLVPSSEINRLLDYVHKFN